MTQFIPQVSRTSAPCTNQYLVAEPYDPTAECQASQHPRAPLTSKVHVFHQPFQISSAFGLDANLDERPYNIIIRSADGIIFAVHLHRLRNASNNGFAGLLLRSDLQPTHDSPLGLIVTEAHDVLNVVLHTIYGLSCDAYRPSTECLTASIDALTKYGILPLQRYLARNASPLFRTFVHNAVTHPVEIYSLAAHHNLEDLAIAASAYTLTLSLHSISQPLATQMGVFYLHRLHKLHSSLIDNLRALVERRLNPHISKPYCTAEQRRRVSDALYSAGMEVVFHATPAISSADISSVMSQVGDTTECPDCKEGVNTHIQLLTTTWMRFSRTI
ncbi:hypothetical protein BDW22DRAFT_240997 [Trametopsis cervina]|nr:hypothetical protein BDW22DRAFT_240997 [Trametopsis cervina]